MENTKNTGAVSLDSKLKWVNKMSKLMDSKFTIPGTKFKFGLDPIIGLIPGIGDLGSYSVSLVLVYTMYRHGASKKLVSKMVVNSTLDMVIGSIPILGSIFDFWFKANNRNVKLLREYYEEGKHGGSGKAYMSAVLVAVALVIAAFIFGIIKIAQASMEALG